MKVSPAPSPPDAVGRARWSSLRGVPLVTLPADNPVQRAIDARVQALGLVRDAADDLSVSFLATQIAMVEAGFGHAVVPTFAIAACRRHRVRMDILGSPQVRLGFHRISRRGVPESEAIRAFDAAIVRQLPMMSR